MYLTPGGNAIPMYSALRYSLLMLFQTFFDNGAISFGFALPTFEQLLNTYMASLISAPTGRER